MPFGYFLRPFHLLIEIYPLALRIDLVPFPRLTPSVRKQVEAVAWPLHIAGPCMDRPVTAPYKPVSGSGSLEIIWTLGEG